MDKFDGSNIYLIASFIGFLGVIAGALISAFTHWCLIDRAAKIRIKEKLFERRITAYEKVMDFCRLLQTVDATEKIGPDGYVVTMTGWLKDQENFELLQLKLYQTITHYYYHLDVETTSELRFIQDYLGNLKFFLKEKPESDYLQYAELLQPDFRKMANDLKESAEKFFIDDIHSLKLKVQKGDAKLSLEENEERISKTKLYKLIGENE